MSKNTDKVDENTWKKVEDAALKVMIIFQVNFDVY